MSLSSSSDNAFEPEEATVRPATNDDVHRMAVLLQSHYNWINVWHAPQEVIHRNVSEELMMAAIQQVPAVVAEVDGIVIGYAITRAQEPFLLEVRQIYVDDPYRNVGTGHLILKMIEDRAREMGYRNLFATCSTSWFPGKVMPSRLFKNAGYTITPIAADTEMYLREIEAPIERRPPDLVEGIASIQRVPWER